MELTAYKTTTPLKPRPNPGGAKRKVANDQSCDSKIRKRSTVTSETVHSPRSILICPWLINHYKSMNHVRDFDSINSFFLKWEESMLVACLRYDDMTTPITKSIIHTGSWSSGVRLFPSVYIFFAFSWRISLIWSLTSSCFALVRNNRRSIDLWFRFIRSRL